MFVFQGAAATSDPSCDHAAFLDEARIERRRRRRDERAEAEDRNGRRHGKSVLPGKDALIVAVEADDHAAVDTDPEVDDPLDFFDQILFQVLPFFGVAQTVFIRRLDPDEHLRQTGIGAMLKQFFVTRRVDRDLRLEPEASTRTPRIPVADRDEQLLGVGAVDREVVVGQKNHSIAEVVELIELGNHLLDLLVALLAAEIGDHVAEVAFERAAARGLHGAHEGAVIRIEVPARDRRRAQIRPGADVLVLPIAAFEIGEYRPGDFLDLALDKDVAMRTDSLRTERRIRAADEDRLAAPPEFRGDALHVAPLAHLAGDADVVRRRVVIDRHEMLVAELNAKARGSHCGNCRDGQIGCRNSGRQSAPAHNLGAEIAGHIRRRIDQINGLGHAPHPYTDAIPQRPPDYSGTRRRVERTPLRNTRQMCMEP